MTHVYYPAPIRSYLPFEGINIPKDKDTSALVLSFPNVNVKQKTMFLSLNGIVFCLTFATPFANNCLLTANRLPTEETEGAR
ncbi:hypothetical protein XBJ2_1000022 [Xenorhabdus bovienii str. Jollieti]|uniref:Uncharacterized protein n=1 Tax=Xenorhabdus bovienii (strain SS-2004) TaxID=406818 RepID=D3V2U4_XENBS|nr:hypothetical protein XBJ1_1933 [Xenorhabdus bovienii SS-2004]CDH26919.1 hypothetical protein XBJ2_1000022 [Xenorhabdus bovienii str. Jollieti]